jgi:phage terminase small subunit
MPKRKVDPATGDPRLTFREERFLDEFATNGGNASRAAASAGYSATRADQSAYQVLRRPEVQRRIAQRIAESRVIADEIIGTLASLMRGTLADFLDESGVFNMDLAIQRGVDHQLKNITTITREIKATEDKPAQVLRTTRASLHSPIQAARALAHILGIDRHGTRSRQAATANPLTTPHHRPPSTDFDPLVWLDDIISDQIRQTGLSRDQVIANLIKLRPEIAKYVIDLEKAQTPNPYEHLTIRQIAKELGRTVDEIVSLHKSEEPTPEPQATGPKSSQQRSDDPTSCPEPHAATESSPVSSAPSAPSPVRSSPPAPAPMTPQPPAPTSGHDSVFLAPGLSANPQPQSVPGSLIEPSSNITIEVGAPAAIMKRDLSPLSGLEIDPAIPTFPDPSDSEPVAPVGPPTAPDNTTPETSDYTPFDPTFHSTFSELSAREGDALAELRFRDLVQEWVDTHNLTEAQAIGAILERAASETFVFARIIDVCIREYKRMRAAGLIQEPIPSHQQQATAKEASVPIAAHTRNSAAATASTPLIENSIFINVSEPIPRNKTVGNANLGFAPAHQPLVRQRSPSERSYRRANTIGNRQLPSDEPPAPDGPLDFSDVTSENSQFFSMFCFHNSDP